MKKLLVGLWLALAAFSASAQDARCLTNPESCLTAPIAKACPAGQKWSTAGSGIAHCVNVDPVCPSDQKVSYDYMGNPSCVNRCSAGEYWNGASCSPCTSTSTASGSCQAGYNGTAYRSVTTNACTGSTSYGSWDYSNCTVACTESSSTESGSCQAGYTGTAYRSVTTNSCSGTTYGSWDYSNCTAAPTCGSTSYNESGSCPVNYTGTAYRTVTRNDCTGALTYGAWNTTSCTYSPSCPAGTAWDGSSCVSTFSCPAYSMGTWTSGTQTFCWTGNDSAVNPSKLYTACKGEGLLEVDRYDSSTGATKFGYVCTYGSTPMYTMSGTRIY